MEVLEDRGIPFNVKSIDARMASLVRSKRLEAQGNIRKWRYSEVRLPAQITKWQNELPLSLKPNIASDKRMQAKRIRSAYWLRSFFSSVRQ
jgi:hypothetical protein